MDEEFILESKKLALEIKANEDKYISGELDLNPTLRKTDRLYQQALSAEASHSTASKYLQDSTLLQLETKIVRQSARSYKVDTLSFEPRAFSTKVKSYFGLGNQDEDGESSTRKKTLFTLWEKLGEYSKETMYTVPTFNFIYGTFDCDPVEPVKKKRRQYVKDKVGDITKPDSMDVNQVIGGQDIMTEEASKILSCFIKLSEKNKGAPVCFYEFVIDPTSFTETVENIFLVSLLVKEGFLCIFSDDQGLPYIRKETPNKTETWRKKNAQCLTISMQEWEDIIKTFNYDSPKIPSRKSQESRSQE